MAGAAHGASAPPVPASPAASVDPGCVPALKAGSQTVTIDVGGTPRGIIIHVPDADPGLQLPAVVAFHGYSSFATELEAVSGLSALADEGSFLVAYPQALGDPTEWHFAGNRGYDQRDITMIRLLRRLLVEQACVDPERVFLAGHSMGGGMASDAACRLADQVAGVALVAALWFELPCQPARPVPVVAFHSLDDPVLPYLGGKIGGVGPGVPEVLPVEDAIAAWAQRDGCGSPPATSPMEDGSAVLAWSDCAAPVVMHRLPSGGHDWPAVASRLIAQMVTAK
jgi:polyhydroxybutyrate depolymerase